MKHFLCALALALASAVASASSLPALRFELNDGSVVTLPSEGLLLTFDSNFMRASHSEGTLDIDLNRLTKFYFYGDFSAISSVGADEPERVKIFSVTGIFCGEYDSLESARAALPAGLYVARTDLRTFKTVVR